ncbi:MAG: HAD family hydrolase [Deltaproteobacteria bacterium]|nr:HAD family hydrolase [Deltaproteobacteria bacterium]
MKKAVLFDLGNTLAEYYESCAYPELLPLCIGKARALVEGLGLPPVPEDTLWRTVHEENVEAPDHCVRPLEGRLLRIFHLDPPSLSPETVTALCRAFMAPIFALGRCYEDTRPTLRDLRARGVKVAVVSNAPWGCPAGLCHEEAERLGVEPLVDAVVFCSDVGWRKPSERIFTFTLERLGVEAADSLFVGDHPEWDLAGPRALGIEAALLDRNGVRSAPGETPIRTLRELWGRW